MTRTRTKKRKRRSKNFQDFVNLPDSELAFQISRQSDEKQKSYTEKRKIGEERQEQEQKRGRGGVKIFKILSTYQILNLHFKFRDNLMRNKKATQKRGKLEKNDKNKNNKRKRRSHGEKFVKNFHVETILN